VLGSELPIEQAATALPLDLVDILLVPNGDERFAEPERRGATLVLRPGTRGQRLGVLTLTLDDQSSIAGWRHEVHAMPPTTPEAERLGPWYQAYNDDLRADYERRVLVRKMLDSGGSPYRGAETCKDCHATAFTAWNASPHAGAHGTLTEVGKAFDPNCLTCHTVGFLEPGGFLDMPLTGHLANVQCESCHGAAAAHADSGGETPTANKGAAPISTCAGCHTGDHSPAFVYDDYWPRIAHGREP